ncbi:MAG: MarR family transcriptional regulator [Brevundimonas sp.]
MSHDAHYWYDDESIAELLEAVRRFRRSDTEMRRRISAGMAMNVTDMQALQYVIATESRGEHAHPGGIAAHLAISTAATTKLLDRLAASGHLVRSTHPTDRRSVVVASTPHAHDQIRARLLHMHQEMARIAAAVPADARPAVRAFLDALSDQLDSEQGFEALTPA